MKINLKKNLKNKKIKSNDTYREIRLQINLQNWEN